MNVSFYPIVVSELSEEDGGGFVAHVLDLYGCTGDGETPEAAVLDAQKAIVEWCAEMNRLGRDIPAPGAALERARHEQEKIRTAIAELAKQAHAIIKEQNDEIDRLLSTISDLQTEISELEADTSCVKVPLWSPVDVVVHHRVMAKSAARH